MRLTTLPTIDRRPLAFGAWAIAVLATALLIGVGTPVLVAEILSGCSADVSTECAYLRLDPAMTESLRAIGLSRSAVAVLVASVDVLPPLIAAVVGGLLVWRRADDRLAVFGAVTLVLFVGTVLQSGVTALGARPEWHWLVVFVQFLGSALLLSFLNVFPDGRFVPSWTRWLVAAWIVWCAIGYFSPTDWPVSQAINGSYFTVGVALFVLVTLTAQVMRYFRASTDTQRRQTKWVLFGFALALAIILVNVQVLPGFMPAPPDPAAAVYLLYGGLSFDLALLLLPVSIAFAVLRYRLFDVDLLISRALIYVGLTSGISAIYVLVVGYLGAIFRAENALPISLLAAAAVAVVFQPLREWLQRGVNRLVYGERDEPYVLLSRLGQRLEGSLPPEAVLPTVVQTVAEALKLPYVAIVLTHADDDTDSVPTASYGQPTGRSECFPLAYANESVGELRVAPRTGTASFSAADRRLFADIARQAGVAAHAVRLSADLQRSRERLVAAREEERRRLRRDLHDGLGPALAAQALKVGSARALYPRDPSLADNLLLQLENDIETTLQDVRRLARGLRPPTLDQLGLAEAIREVAERYAPALHTTIRLDSGAAQLPAGVEVAVYRIVEEALTNVVRHAHAHSCEIALVHRADCLRLRICDDGVGIHAIRPTGIGLTSMRERAEELGGSFAIRPNTPHGTCVDVELPLRSAAD